MTGHPGQAASEAPCLDIMIPFWGEVAYLRETVASVLGQTNPSWRLTVLDDASPDESAADLCASTGDPRVTYVRNPTNEGITASFEKCAHLATGDLVTIPGCDDILLPNYVDVVLRAHRDFGDADIIQPAVRVIDEHGAPAHSLADTVKRLVMPRVTGPTILHGEPLAVSLLRGDWLYWPSLTFRRELLVSTPFRPGLPVIQDLALIIDLVLAGARLLVDPSECFAYRRHSASASSVRLIDGSRFEGERAYFDLAAELAKASGWNRAARAARRHVTSRAHALTMLPSALTRRDRTAASVVLRHAFRP